MSTTRRRLLGLGLGAACAGAASCVAGPLVARAQDQLASPPDPSGPRPEEFPAVRARYWRPLEHGRIECRLCPARCQVADRERGSCGCRENRGGIYYTLVHSRAAAVHVDPVEKKPFFHVVPGARTLSLATAGCNLQCHFCQNWRISQFRPEQLDAERLPPDELHRRATAGGLPFLAYTYSEPTVFYEYVLDTARRGTRSGVRSLLVSSGYIAPEPLTELLPHLAAVKIDLKAFTERFYSELCGGHLKPVLEAIRTVRRAGTWLELVVLLVPGHNDSDDELRRLARWVKEELGTHVPLHFSRFRPSYRLRSLPPTPVATLRRARSIARAEGLDFVYIGNLPGDPAANTRCPGCDALLVERWGFSVLRSEMTRGVCPSCGRKIPGVWT